MKPIEMSPEKWKEFFKSNPQPNPHIQGLINRLNEEIEAEKRVGTLKMSLGKTEEANQHAKRAAALMIEINNLYGKVIQDFGNS